MAHDLEEVVSIAAPLEEDGIAMYHAVRAIPFAIRSVDWFAEAGPFSNLRSPEEFSHRYARALIGYNAWAASVGRPLATVADLVDGGAGSVLSQVFTMVLSWPVRRSVTEHELASWSAVDRCSGS